jgi:hypothetical protein
MPIGIANNLAQQLNAHNDLAGTSFATMLSRTEWAAHKLFRRGPSRSIVIQLDLIDTGIEKRLYNLRVFMRNVAPPECEYSTQNGSITFHRLEQAKTLDGAHWSRLRRCSNYHVKRQKWKYRGFV